MARIRTIKPEFWSNEALNALPESTHLLAAALLNYADDFGYFNANPLLIKAACFPLREPSVPISESLRKLSGILWIDLGEGPEGRIYGRINKFSVHQRISHPTPSKIQVLPITWPDFRNPPEILRNPPEYFRPEQGTGNKEQGIPPTPLPGGEFLKTLPTNPGLPKRQKPPTVDATPNPEGLDVAAWEKWTNYRKAIGKPLKPASYSAAKRELTTHAENQMAVVDKSIANGWQGLFALRSLGVQNIASLRLSDEERDNAMRRRFLGADRKPE